MAAPTRLTEEVVRDYLRRGLWKPTSLSDHWDRNASRDPGAVAVTDGSTRITWAEARLWTDRLAMGLIQVGLGRDDALVVQLPNCVELPLIRVACEKAGVLCLPVPRTLRHNEMSHCLGASGAVAAVVPWRHRDFDYFGMMRELQESLPHLRQILVAGEDVPQGALSVADFARYPWEESVSAAVLESRRFKASEVSLINSTTGSTGLPKLAEYTAAARLLYGRSYIEVLELTQRDIVVALSPAAGGPNIPVYFAAPQVGARTVFLEHFNSEAAFQLIQQEESTVACVVPAALALMVRHPLRERYDLSSVRLWLSVGAPLPSTLAQETEEKLGGTVVNCYGAVDWGGVVLTSPCDPPEVRFLTVGKPRLGTEIRIVDEEGTPVGAGQVGEVQGRGPSCSTGYYGDSETTHNTWTSDGWLPLGDLARWDGRGNLMLVGRKQELIIRGGQNIQPTEIENHLLAHPKVRQAAVVGMPDPVFGERVCAYVVPRTAERPTLGEIASFLRSRNIALFKLPERLEVVDSLPMVSETKVDKKVLAADVAEKTRKAL